MVAELETPSRHRAETTREQDLRLELTALRSDVRTYCDFLTPRISALVPMCMEIGPEALQIAAGAERLLTSLRERAR